MRGDCVVHRVRAEAHTLRGGPRRLSVLAFGGRALVGGAHLPQVGIRWLNPSWSEAGTGVHPFDREPNLTWPDPTSERPPSIVAAADVEGEYGGAWKRLGGAAGAKRSGLNLAVLPPHEEGAAPHCHSAEEELFVILAGSGTLELWGPPRPHASPPVEPDDVHELRAGHVIARPPGTRVSHCLRAGDESMTYLAYGTREPNDVCYYPRSNKLFFRGVGLMARLEPLDYFDGEPS
jgi:uncharacterized cupin superfamily protein